MDIALAGIFVLFFVSVRLSSAYIGDASNSFDKKGGDLSITSGGFQALHPHPALKKCADAVLKEVSSVALRVNELTGQCEELDFFWLFHPIIESGYAYAKRVSYRENFQPPVEVDQLLAWYKPGIFNEGSRLDLFISITKPNRFMHKGCPVLWDAESEEALLGHVKIWKINGGR